MAARKKPAAKKSDTESNLSAVFDTLALTLGNISALFGYSTVTLGGKFTPNTLIAYMGDPGPRAALKKDGIHVTVVGFSTRIYTMNGVRLLLTRDEGTPKRPKMVSSLVNIEEPIAFLLEHTSTNDEFKNVTDYIQYEDVKV